MSRCYCDVDLGCEEGWKGGSGSSPCDDDDDDGPGFFIVFIGFL